jgi:hypothetical protein
VILERIEIAGLRVDLEVDGPLGRIPERYGAFAGAWGPADYLFAVRPGLPSLGRLTGRAARRHGRVRVEGAESMGWLDPAARRAEAVVDGSLVALDGLLRAALTLEVLARGGCLFHAAAAVVEGRAHLFPGRSGSGKSTLAALARAPLSDELCAVVPGPEGFRVHGTPWWIGRQGWAPLGGVHALSWSGEGVAPMTRAEGLRHLVSNITLFVDEAGTRAAAFEAAARIAAAAPFARFAFTPASDVDALLGAGRRAA